MASKRKTKAKEHPCFAKVDDLLREQGDCLQRMISITNSPRTVYVATERVGSASWKRGSSWLAASFCPFCGVAMVTGGTDPGAGNG